MLKPIFTSTSILALVLSCHLPVQAQNAAPAPKPQQQTTTQTQVTPQELQKFANAFQQLQVIRKDARQQMLQALQQEGLTPDRFYEIYQAQQGSASQPAKPVSQADKQKFAQAVNKIASIQEQMQPKMKKAVQDQGLEVERFEQILAAVRQSPDLQQQVQRLLKG